MKSSFKKLPGSVIELDVEMTLPEFNQYWQPIFDAAQAKVQIKGFRPGQAPPELTKQGVDTEKVFERAGESAVRQSLNDIVEENKWIVIDQPRITIKDGSDSFSYHASLMIFPEIRLPDYKTIAKKQTARIEDQIKAVIVTGEEIEKTLAWLRKSHANLNNFKDEQALRQSIGQGIKMEKETRERDRVLIRILDEVAKQAEIDVPQVMVDKVGDRQRLLRHLIIYKIAETEKLQPTAEEVETEAGRWPEHKVDKDKFYNYLYEQVQQRKVYEKLLSANGN